MSPTCSLPLLISTVATAPRPRSRLDFEHHAGGRTRVGRLEVEQLGLQQQRIEQLVDALAGERRHADEQRLAAPLLGDQLVLRELPANAIEIAAGLVDLVDRDDDRHLGRFRVLDGLDRLRHDAVVGRDDEHDDVRDLGAARAHGREGRVARRVEERDAAFRRLDVVGADVLRDAARLARGHLRAPDVVEQRRLAVVDVAHDRDDGRASNRLGRARGLLDGLDELVLDRRFLERASRVWPISSTTRVAVS